ncbi:MAG: sensor histidine kinase [Bacteroidota bacterium]|nr:sensor histidine kinase [Bacteroidota bacterium]
MVFTHQKRQTQHLREKEGLKLAFEKEILSAQLEIQEQTLKNISQEIHDNIGQVLSLAKLNVNTMDCDQPENLKGKIADSKHLISKAIQDLRDLSRSLNSDYVIDMGLLRSVEYELEMIRKAGAIETKLQVEGKPYRLEQQQELILFRIVQEILHNIIKHAKATEIVVQFGFDADVFKLSVADNGVGFDASKLESADYSGFGLGIRNMYNRAKMINTKFQLRSTSGEGVCIDLELPVSLKVQS